MQGGAQGRTQGAEVNVRHSRHFIQFAQAMHRQVHAATAEACARFEQRTATIPAIQVMISC